MFVIIFMYIVLDSGVLGMISNPHPKRPQTIACNQRFAQMVLAGHTVCLPEIIDYEQRRIFEHGNWKESIERLDSLKKDLMYLPINTEVMLTAAKFWAEARKNDSDAPKKPKNQRLDIDVILAAQAKVNIKYAGSVIIATSNVRDLAPFAVAREWQNIAIK